MEQGDSAAVARYGERAVHVDATEIKNWETLAIQSFVDYVGEERVREEQVERARGEQRAARLVQRPAVQTLVRADRADEA